MSSTAWIMPRPSPGVSGARASTPASMPMSRTSSSSTPTAAWMSSWLASATGSRSRSTRGGRLDGRGGSSSSSSSYSSRRPRPLASSSLVLLVQLAVVSSSTTGSGDAVAAVQRQASRSRAPSLARRGTRAAGPALAEHLDVHLVLAQAQLFQGLLGRFVNGPSLGLNAFHDRTSSDAAWRRFQIQQCSKSVRYQHATSAALRPPRPLLRPRHHHPHR